MDVKQLIEFATLSDRVHTDLLYGGEYGDFTVVWFMNREGTMHFRMEYYINGDELVFEEAERYVPVIKNGKRYYSMSTPYGKLSLETLVTEVF